MDTHDKQRINSIKLKYLHNYHICKINLQFYNNILWTWNLTNWTKNRGWNRGQTLLPIRYNSHKWNSTVLRSVCQLSNSWKISLLEKREGGNKICKRWINVSRNCVDDICIGASTRPNSQSDRWGRKIFSDSPYVSMGWYPLLGFLLTQHME